MNKGPLAKVSHYVINIVFGGNDPKNEDARSARAFALRLIAENPERFLTMAHEKMSKDPSGGENPRGWVMGAVHYLYDANITIDNPDHAAQHIMKRMMKRFRNEMPATTTTCTYHKH